MNADPTRTEEDFSTGKLISTDHSRRLPQVSPVSVSDTNNTTTRCSREKPLPVRGPLGPGYTGQMRPTNIKRLVWQRQKVWCWICDDVIRRRNSSLTAE